MGKNGAKQEGKRVMGTKTQPLYGGSQNCYKITKQVLEEVSKPPLMTF